MARRACALSVVLWLAASVGGAAEPETPPVASVPPPADTNTQQLLQLVLQLEAGLRSNQLALELNNAEFKLASARNAEALSNGLATIENALVTRQEAFSARTAQELETLQQSNRAMLMVAGSFAGIAALAMLVVAYFQWRMSRLWTGISTALPMLSGLGQGHAGALGPGGGGLTGSAEVEGANARLLGAMERLEKRVDELEASSEEAVEPQSRGLLSGDNGDSPGGGNGDETAPGTQQSSTDETTRTRLLLKQGQSLLKENKLEAALGCFDEVLSLVPDQPEALVKKGAALERLHKLNEAFECYDRAITVDGSMTMAYLYKGGLCSRLERFKEALECYEKALRTHDEKHG